MLKIPHVVASNIFSSFFLTWCELRILARPMPLTAILLSFLTFYQATEKIYKRQVILIFFIGAKPRFEIEKLSNSLSSRFVSSWVEQS
jgi:hypothetical protein